jgi:hypothetical protein
MSYVLLKGQGARLFARSQPYRTRLGRLEAIRETTHVPKSREDRRCYPRLLSDAGRTKNAPSLLVT